jgi:hypothetical protein
MNDENFEGPASALDEEGRGDFRRKGSGRVYGQPLDENGRVAFQSSAQQRSSLGAIVSGQLQDRAFAGVSNPVGALAADLCETAIYEAMPPEEIVRTARACREAAEICYGYQTRALKPLSAMTRAEVERKYPTRKPWPEGLPSVEETLAATRHAFEAEAHELPDHPKRHVAFGDGCSVQTAPPPPAAVEGGQSVLTPGETTCVKETIQGVGNPLRGGVFNAPPMEDMTTAVTDHEADRLNDEENR